MNKRQTKYLKCAKKHELQKHTDLNLYLPSRLDRAVMFRSVHVYACVPWHGLQLSIFYRLSFIRQDEHTASAATHVMRARHQHPVLLATAKSSHASPLQDPFSALEDTTSAASNSLTQQGHVDGRLSG
jgi:hypothetical protein